MNRILKKIRTGILAAGFISVSALAMAQNVLPVPGLGTIPLPHDMQLVDGKGSSVEKCLLRTRSVLILVNPHRLHLWK